MKALKEKLSWDISLWTDWTDRHDKKFLAWGSKSIWTVCISLILSWIEITFTRVENLPPVITLILWILSVFKVNTLLSHSIGLDPQQGKTCFRWCPNTRKLRSRLRAVFYSAVRSHHLLCEHTTHTQFFQTLLYIIFENNVITKQTKLSYDLRKVLFKVIHIDSICTVLFYYN